MNMGNCSTKNKVAPISEKLEFYPVTIDLPKHKRVRQPFIEERMMRPQKLQESEYYVAYPLPSIHSSEE